MIIYFVHSTCKISSMYIYVYLYVKWRPIFCKSVKLLEIDGNSIIFFSFRYSRVVVFDFSFILLPIYFIHIYGHAFSNHQPSKINLLKNIFLFFRQQKKWTDNIIFTWLRYQSLNSVCVFEFLPLNAPMKTTEIFISQMVRIR